MEKIKILTDEDFGLQSIAFHNPRHRVGARGIILNQQDQIAILHKKAKNEYKLIGGGMEDGETPEETFYREGKEETGCNIKIEKCLGVTEELKSQDNFKQTSYVYIAHIVGKNGISKFTEQEKEEGSELLWLDLEEAMKQIQSSEEHLLPSPFESKMSVYHTKFIVRRDYEILKYYKQNPISNASTNK